jgi:hypothetical protein
MICSELNNQEALLKLAFGSDDSSLIFGSVGNSLERDKLFLRRFSVLVTEVGFLGNRRFFEFE